ncbi:MAG: branched-chain amino acid ABC transporter permease [Actinomycetia bacterium]|nr:branched-chain amino acid ABC transporter permease [Actinomycetes bacterium]
MRQLLPTRADDRWFVYWPLVIISLVLAHNLLPGSYGDYVLDVATLGSIFAIGAIGLNVQFGFTGLLNFGHVMSMMIGAYTMAILILDMSWNPAIAMVCGGLVAAGAGLIVGLFSLRLRTDYLAIVTIAIAEMVRLIIKNSGNQRIDPETGLSVKVGTGGVFGLQNYSGGINDWLETVLPFLDSQAWRQFTLNALFITVALFLTWTLKRSPWGRVQRAIKEDQEIVSALGKPTLWLKLQSFALGSFIGAFSGIAFALQTNFIESELWLPIVTFRLWIAMMLGGAGSIFGPVAGALALQALFSVVRFLPRIQKSVGIIPEQLVSSNRIFALQGMLLGLLIMLVVRFRPQGMFGKREELALERIQ